MQLNALREVEHCWIPAADGTRLSARLWLPLLPGNAPAPAILEYIPYRKRDMVRARDARNHPFFARHGYACVRVDMRGSGDSEGLMTDMYGDAERDDVLAVIDWIARQRWCNGAVGMMGTSWGGTSALQAAVRRPAPLRAVIAVCATDDRFDDDIHHLGGCLLTDTVEWGATLPAILAAPPDPRTVGPAWRWMWQARLEGLSFPLEHWIRHASRDAYWRSGSVSETAAAIRCPTLLIGGWVDRYSNTVMNLLARAPHHCWGIVGPWGHHYPDVASPGPAIGFQQEALRWWDRWLKDIANEVDRAPRLRVWLQHYTPPRNMIERRPGRWIAEAAWPSHRITAQPFWLHPGRLSETRPAAPPVPAEVPASLAVGAGAGDTGYFGRAGGLPGDQRQDDERSLVFETRPLAQPLTILGSAHLEVSLEADQRVATLVARLNDVPVSGPVARVTWTARNLALDEHGACSPLVPRERRAVALAFANTAYRFERGHRIRLALSGSYWPLIWPTPVPARVTLHLDATRLILPVRDPSAIEWPVHFDAPQDLEDASTLIRSAPSLVRRALVDERSGRRSSLWHQPFRCVHHAAIDLDFGFETRAEHAIVGCDPLSAASRFDHRLRLARNEWVVEIGSMAQLTASAATYDVDGELVIRENGELIFERRWTPAIPRDCS